MGWQDVDLAHTTLQLTEELGELVQVINVLERHPEVSRAEALRADAGREIVDCLNYLLAIANRLEVDLGDVFQQVNTTNQRRVWPAP